MNSLQQIKDSLIRRKPALASRFKVRQLGIFGSCVRGEQKRGSDIDILVDFDEVPDLFEFWRLERYLHRALGRKVDLVRKPAIRKELRDRILREVVYI